MLTISLPHIAIQKVTNGYVVQWEKTNDPRNAQRKIHMSAVCLTKEQLLETIEKASLDIEEAELK